MEQFHATTCACVAATASHWRRWPGHPGQHRHQGHGAQDPPPVPRQDPGRLRRRHRRRLHAAGALRGQAREAPGNLMRAAVELTRDWRTDRVLRRLEAMLIVADAEHTLVLTGNGDVLEPSTAWRPSARAAPMPSRPRWRCCATPYPRPSSSSRWKSPATQHLHQPEPRHRNAGRMTTPRGASSAAPPPAPPSPKDPLSCPHPT